MTDAAIDMDDVVKVYPNGVRALDRVTLAVPQGSVCAFLGRNGAGKTTTVRVLSTLSSKTSGRVSVCGMDIDTRPAEVRRLIGVALQNSALDDLMTAREHIELVSGLAGYRGQARRQRATDLLELLGLTGAGNRVVATYSGGMRRRLEFGLALIQRPRVLFLDEPSAGLDLQSRMAVWKIIRDLRADGSTIFLTTHDFGEANQLSDMIAVIDDGQIRGVGSPARLKEWVGGATTVLHLAHQAGERQLVRVFGDGATPVDGIGVRVAGAGSGEQLRELLTRAHESGLVVARVEVTEPSLADVYMRLTGSEMSNPGNPASAPVERHMGVPRYEAVEPRT
jgi:ABC-2 type transport system ATP-binding protein